MDKKPNRYSQIIEAIFLKHYQGGMDEITFDRQEFIQVAGELGITLPKNLGDLLYTFRYRAELPTSITAKATPGSEWIIRPAGRGRYKLVLSKQANIVPSPMMVETKILDATPGIIAKYSLNDEQAVLARIRYNRLVDIFTGIACYSLQNHLRTTVKDIGQVETDEIYIGVDKRGAQYVLPVQAKGGRDRMGIVQIEQDFLVCKAKFPNLICRSIAAQSMADGVIAMFEFEETKEGIKVAAEKHYRLVSSDELSPEEMETYQKRPL
jgi:hypothetical protein